MAKLNSIIASIQSKVKGDKRLVALLTSIASGQFTAAEFKEFEALVKRLFYLAEYSGYQWQASVIRRPITRAGILAVAEQAAKVGSLVAQRITTTLEERPELASSLRDSVLAHSAVYQGVTDGQQVTAQEYGLMYKTWIRSFDNEESRPHSSLEGTTIGRDELFTLPSGIQVTGPHDWSRAGASEWAFCGHQIIYTNSK